MAEYINRCFMSAVQVVMMSAGILAIFYFSINSIVDHSEQSIEMAHEVGQVLAQAQKEIEAQNFCVEYYAKK